MARSLRTLPLELKFNFTTLERTRIKTESLAGAASFTQKEIEQIYGMLFLNALMLFENFIETIFLGLLTGKIASSKVHPKTEFRSERVAKEIVLGRWKYVDWLPYEEGTEKLAKAFFRNGLPFTILNNPDKQTLKQLWYIRNALSHKSKYALQNFENHVISSIPLIKKERTPSGFLRSKFRALPSQTRYEVFVANLADLANKICTVRQSIP